MRIPAAGLPLADFHPTLGEGAFLVCATETKTNSDIDEFAKALGAALAA